MTDRQWLKENMGLNEKGFKDLVNQVLEYQIDPASKIDKGGSTDDFLKAAKRGHDLLMQQPGYCKSHRN